MCQELIASVKKEMLLVTIYTCLFVVAMAKLTGMHVTLALTVLKNTQMESVNRMNYKLQSL